MSFDNVKNNNLFFVIKKKFQITTKGYEIF